MRLLHFASYHANTVKNDGIARMSRADNYKRYLYSIELFLKDKPDTELINFIDVNFIIKYGHYLFGGQFLADVDSQPSVKSRPESKATLIKHFTFFRTVARKAIQLGLIPNVDVFKPAMHVLASEYDIEWRAKNVEKAHETRVANTPDSALEFSRLSTILDKDLTVRYKVARALPALIYTFGIYSYGLEFDDLLNLSEINGEITVKKYGTELPILHKASIALDTINRYKRDYDKLIKRSAEWSRIEASGGNLADWMKERTSAYFKSNGINLFQDHSILTDWLKIGADKGLKAAKLASLANLTDVKPEVEEIYETAQKINGEYEYWYVLCSYSSSLRNDKLKAIVNEYFIDKKDSAFTEDKIFDPNFYISVKSKGRTIKRKSSLTSRFLFIKATPEDAWGIDRLSKDASLLRQPDDRKKLAVIKEDSIFTLKYELEKIGRGSNIVTVDLEEERATFRIGVKVRITDDLLEGLEGTIVKIKKITNNNLTFNEYHIKIDCDIPIEATKTISQIGLVK